MKSWSHLCVLVLAISSLSRGEDVSKPHEDPVDKKHTDETPAPFSPDKSENVPTSSPPPPGDSTTVVADRDVTTTQDAASTSQSNDTRKNIVDPSEGGNTTSTTAATTATTTVETASASSAGKHGSQAPAVSTAATSSPAESETGETYHSSWGYIILVFILLVIIILCVILYLLRRVSRTYSFDLQRPVPANHHSEPTGTFEPVYLDDLDRPAPKDPETPDDLSPHPVANGTTVQSEEKASNGETGSQEQPEANGLEASPGSTGPPSLGGDPADGTSGPLSATNLLFDAVGEEQQNENNNNPSVCSSDPFVEINLDDPAWCDQFLSSAAPPSSVLPFAPFSVSSSSSSSS